MVMLFSSLYLQGANMLPGLINKMFLGPPSSLGINNNLVISHPFTSCAIKKFGIRGGVCFPSKSVVMRSNEAHSNSNQGEKSADDDFVLIPPLHLKSSAGQFLEQLLQTDPSLFSAALDKQLEELAHKTITEKEKRAILEELIYCSIVKMFRDRSISMITKISPAFDPALIHPNRWEITHYPDIVPGSLESSLETIHTPEALDVIYSHLIVLPPFFRDHRSETQDSHVNLINKSQLGLIYADSVIFSYSLKQIEQLYGLERLVNLSKYSRGGLMVYVSGLDNKRVRSMEGFCLIRKHVEALFGGSVEENDRMLTLRELNLIILEGIAFGKFLVDGENHINSKYPFMDS